MYLDRSGPCKSRWLGYPIYDLTVGAAERLYFDEQYLAGFEGGGQPIAQ